MLTGGFYLQHEVPYQYAAVNTALKCTTLSCGYGTDRQNDGQTGKWTDSNFVQCPSSLVLLLGQYYVRICSLSLQTK